MSKVSNRAMKNAYSLIIFKKADKEWTLSVYKPGLERPVRQYNARNSIDVRRISKTYRKLFKIPQKKVRCNDKQISKDIGVEYSILEDSINSMQNITIDTDTGDIDEINEAAPEVHESTSSVSYGESGGFEAETD